MQPIRPASPPMNTHPPINPRGGSPTKLSSVSNDSANSTQLGAISKVKNTNDMQETGSPQGASNVLPCGHEPVDQNSLCASPFLQAIRDAKTQSDGQLKLIMDGPIRPLSPETKEKNTLDFLTAANNGYLQSVQFLIARSIDVNSPAPDKVTALHLAAKNRHIEVLKFLIENGADVNAKTDEKKTPLHMAAEAGHTEVVKFLIEKGANINSNASKKMTALHFAAINGDPDTVKTLLENGANPYAKAKNHLFSQSTPVDLAEKNGHPDIVKILKEVNQPKPKDH